MPPAIEFENVVKRYQALRPLRVQHLTVAEGERVSITGLDRAAAELFVNLVNGSVLPDQGEVRVFGTPTSAIEDASEWLRSLDRFGVVTERAVLLEGFQPGPESCAAGDTRHRSASCRGQGVGRGAGS